MAIPLLQEELNTNTKKKTSFFQTTIFNRSFLVACITSSLLLGIILLAIVLFIGKTGLLVFKDVSPKHFFFSLKWTPESNHFGSGIFVIGTFCLTALAMLITVPISLCIAIYNSEFAPKWLSNIIGLLLDILVGIPSIVYGYLGATLLVPFIREVLHTDMGDGLLAAALVLSVMCIPTVAKITEDAFLSVPNELKEASFGLGSTHIQMIRRVLIPSSLSGITTAVVLGMARAIGETMAVVMVIGNTAQLAHTLTTPTAVLTSNIVMQIQDVAFDSTWNYALYMMAFLLLCISLILIVIVRKLRNKGVQ